MTAPPTLYSRGPSQPSAPALQKRLNEAQAALQNGAKAHEAELLRMSMLQAKREVQLRKKSDEEIAGLRTQVEDLQRTQAETVRAAVARAEYKVAQRYEGILAAAQARERAAAQELALMKAQPAAGVRDGGGEIESPPRPIVEPPPPSASVPGAAGSGASSAVDAASGLRTEPTSAGGGGGGILDGMRRIQQALGLSPGTNARQTAAAAAHALDLAPTALEGMGLKD